MGWKTYDALLLGAFLACSLFVQSGATSVKTLGDLSHQMIVPLDGAPCVKLLTRTSEIGCETNSVVTSNLQRIVTLDDVLRLDKNHNQHAVLMPRDLFLPFLARTLKDPILRSKVAGILVEYSDRLPVTFSPGDPFPQVELSTTPHSKYTWNPFGTAASHRKYGFPIVALNQESTELAVRRAQANEGKGFIYPMYGVKFDYKMQATGNSIRCLQNKRCLPVGGYSVFTELSSSNASTSSSRPEPAQTSNRPVVLVLARMDSASFFHDLALGADVPLSGLLIMLAAVDLLSEWGYTHPHDAHDADTDEDANWGPKGSRIAFAALSGEDWGYMGSRHLIQDLEEGSDSVGGVRLDDVKTIVELGELGLAFTAGRKAQVYVHTERTPESESVALLNALRKGAEGSDASFERPSAHVPGVPPSSYTSFLKLPKRIFNACVLTEYDDKYVNPYAQSGLDGPDNALNYKKMADVAIALARTLATMANGEPAPDVTSDVVDSTTALLEQLADCLLRAEPGLSCPLAQALMSTGSEAASHYTGVLRTLRENVQYQHDKSHMARFVWNFLADRTGKVDAEMKNCTHECEGAGEVCVAHLATGPGHCVNATTKYVRAVSPSLSFSTEKWIWLVDESKLGDDPLYTQSEWHQSVIGTSLFLRDGPHREQATFLIGVGLTLVAGVVSFCVSTR